MKKIKELGLIILPFITNKYLVCTAAFIIWMTFFDKNSVIDQFTIYAKLKKVESSKVYHQIEIEKNKESLHELKTNRKNLEKFAREKYLMKKDDEDVFVFVHIPKE